MTSRWFACRVFVLAGVTASIVSCADRLPDQDLRVLSTTPAAKLSADLLWQEFHTDAPKARGTYHGQVVEITGHAEPPAEGVVPVSLTFSQTDGGKITAMLLADRAAETTQAARTTPRVTLRCFVEGEAPGAPATDVVLKSCIHR